MEKTKDYINNSHYHVPRQVLKITFVENHFLHFAKVLWELIFQERTEFLIFLA